LAVSYRPSAFGQTAGAFLLAGFDNCLQRPLGAAPSSIFVADGLFVAEGAFRDPIRKLFLDRVLWDFDVATQISDATRWRFGFRLTLCVA